MTDPEHEHAFGRHKVGWFTAYMCRTNRVFGCVGVQMEHTQINTTRSKVVLRDDVLQIASWSMCLTTR